jgi:hypothetical protein
MLRTVWLGLIFSVAICCAIAYRIDALSTSAHQTTSADPTAAIDDTQGTPLAKADRLDVNFLKDVPDKTPEYTIPIVLPEPAAIVQPEKTSKIISRHWHEGYASITKRSIRRQREASRSKHGS